VRATAGTLAGDLAYPLSRAETAFQPRTLKQIRPVISRAHLDRKASANTTILASPAAMPVRSSHDLPLSKREEATAHKNQISFLWHDELFGFYLSFNYAFLGAISPW
jgi:hypothetical protein